MTGWRGLPDPGIDYAHALKLRLTKIGLERHLPDFTLDVRFTRADQDLNLSQFMVRMTRQLLAYDGSTLWVPATWQDHWLDQHRASGGLRGRIARWRIGRRPIRYVAYRASVAFPGLQVPSHHSFRERLYWWDEVPEPEAERPAVYAERKA